MNVQYNTTPVPAPLKFFDEWPINKSLAATFTMCATYYLSIYITLVYIYGMDAMLEPNKIVKFG